MPSKKSSLLSPFARALSKAVFAPPKPPRIEHAKRTGPRTGPFLCAEMGAVFQNMGTTAPL